MRWKSLVVSAVLTGCASSSQSVVPQEGQTSATQLIDTELGLFNMDVVASRSIVTTAILAPPSHVWQVLPNVFAALSLPVTGVEEKVMSLGAKNVRVRGQFNSVRLSRLVDCGGGGVSAPNADRYTVFLSVAAQVGAADSGATILRTQVTASAQPEASRGATVRCGTTGALERMVVGKVHELLLAAQK